MNIDDIKQNSYSDLEEFKHFLMCYFNMSADYDELEDLVIEYKQKESSSDVKKLLNEMKFILNSNNLEYIISFIGKNGNRYPNQKRVKWIVDTIIRQLSNEEK